jgi:tetratricopeptide (TPR) repeat protein
VEEAVADVTAAIDLEPDDIDTLALAYVNRSIALSKLERTDEAVADLRIVVELVPQTHELNRQAVALLA